MKAYLRSARIAPKKANLIAKMVRGMAVSDAIKALEHTHKKGARFIETLLKSAVANAHHNEKQDTSALVIKTIVVNQGAAYRRSIPKARGSVRPIAKFLSHISLTLGIAEMESDKSQKKQKSQGNQKKDAPNASQKSKNKVKGTHASKEQKVEEQPSSESSASSVSSAS